MTSLGEGIGENHSEATGHQRCLDLTYLERLWQYFAALIKTCLNTLARFCNPGPSFRAYLDVIANTFNDFSLLQGYET